MDTGEARARGAWLFSFFFLRGGGWGWGAHAFAGKAQQLRGSDAEQKKSESSTSHKTLSSGIVYRQTGITAPPPPPHPIQPALTTLSHTCRQKVPPPPQVHPHPPRVPLPQHTHQLLLSPVLFKTGSENLKVHHGLHTRIILSGH